VDFLKGKRDPRQQVTQRGIYAADYFGPDEWSRLRPQRPATLNRLLTSKVGWGVVHLTIDRARSTPQDKEWNALEMANALVPALSLPTLP